MKLVHGLEYTENSPHGRPRTQRNGRVSAVSVSLIAIAWTPPAGAPSPEATLDGLIELRRAAGQN